jgi:hypothetical protein
MKVIAPIRRKRKRADDVEGTPGSAAVPEEESTPAPAESTPAPAESAELKRSTLMAPDA